MMIVVPAFAERDEREQQAVATFIAGVEPALSENVRERIDEERSMKKDRRADEEAPHEQLPASHAERGSEIVQTCAESDKEQRETRGDHEIEAV